MAVYNGEEFLEESIDSILKQTYKDFKFIIVNDGSQDKTKKILDNITDPRVKVYHLDKNHGVSYARNFAINKAQNQWIVLQDDDDISLPNRIEELMNYSKTHPNVICVFSMRQLITAKTPVHGKPLPSYENKVSPFLTRKQIKLRSFYFPFICYGTAMLSREAILQAGGYDPRYNIAEDYDLFLRLLEVGSIDMVPKILYQYRYDPCSAHRRNRVETRASIIKVSVKNIKKMFEKKGELPNFALLGLKTDCENFIKTICPDCGIHIKLCLDNSAEDHLNQAYELFKRKNINGVIVLDGIQVKLVLIKLIQRGMTLNKNLFHLKRLRKKSR
jgi:glycosyltransferase involved in cell wall biosynthesis